MSLSVNLRTSILDPQCDLELGSYFYSISVSPNRRSLGQKGSMCTPNKSVDEGFAIVALILTKKD